MSGQQNSGDAITDKEARLRTIKRAESRHSGFKDATQAGQESGQGVRYGTLKITHPDYDAKYWRRLRALYAGGKKLLGDLDLLKEIFPKHRGEIDDVYSERIRRACYTPYAGEIIDDIVAMLCAEPVTMGSRAASDEDESHPIWYDAFSLDVAPQEAEAMPLNELLRKCVLTALICRTAWVLVDLPDMRDLAGNAPVYPDRLAQEKSSALDAYAVAIEPESVIDWEEDASKTLEWALVYTQEARRGSIRESRNRITETWTEYRTDGWTKYSITRPRDVALEDHTIIPIVAEGSYGTGRVPLIRFTVPDGLCAMEKLEGLAREHFNKQSALFWAILQSLLPELYEFNGPEAKGVMGGTAVGKVQSDPNRSTNQARGQGYVQKRGSGDRVEFVGPDAEPFKEARESLREIKDEMHRVTHQMALSVDNSASALGRSGESKKQDQSSKMTVLGALGDRVRRFSERLFAMVSYVRGEPTVASEWSAAGCETFDDVQASDEIDKGLSLEQISIPSATFQQLWKFSLAKTALGENATQDDLDAIKKELGENITGDMFDMMGMPQMDNPVIPDDDDDDLDEEHLAENNDSAQPAPKDEKKPKPGKKTMMSTKR